MRNLEAIESDLAAAREALLSVEGTPTEVYSRIVGYYRSVRNWNRGKREEYGERLLYHIDSDGSSACDSMRGAAYPSLPLTINEQGTEPHPETAEADCNSLMLFTRPSCPACPSAIRAAEGLGIHLVMVNTDTVEGMAEAVRRKVMSVPTAILLSPEGKEIKRAHNAEGIGKLINTNKAGIPAGRSILAAIPLNV